MLQLGTCRNRDAGMSSFSLLVLQCWLCHPVCHSQSIFDAWPDYSREPVTSAFYPLPYREVLSAHLQSHFLFFLAVCGLDLDSEWAEDFSLNDI